MFAMGPGFFRQDSGGYATLALTGTFPAATVGVPYSASLAIAGGSAPYSLTGGTGVASGSLPAGLALSIVGSTLVLSGTPTTAATATFVASVTSTDSQTATSAQSIVVSGGTVYATWDSAKKPSQINITSANDATQNVTNASYATIGATTGKSSGKWLFRLKCTNNDFFAGIGSIYHDSVAGDQFPWVNSYYLGLVGGTVGNSIGFENYNGKMFRNSKLAGSASTAPASGVAANAYLTLAVDLDSSPQTVSVYDGNTLKNSMNIPATDAGLTWFPCASTLLAGQVCTIDAGASAAIAIPTPLAGLGYNGYWG